MENLNMEETSENQISQLLPTRANRTKNVEKTNIEGISNINEIPNMSELSNMNILPDEKLASMISELSSSSMNMDGLDISSILKRGSSSRNIMDMEKSPNDINTISTSASSNSASPLHDQLAHFVSTRSASTPNRKRAQELLLSLQDPLIPSDNRNIYSENKNNFLGNKNNYLENKNIYLENKNNYSENKNNYLENKNDNYYNSISNKRLRAASPHATRTVTGSLNRNVHIYQENENGSDGLIYSLLKKNLSADSIDRGCAMSGSGEISWHNHSKALLQELDKLRSGTPKDIYRRERQKVVNDLMRAASKYEKVSGIYFDKHQLRWSVGWAQGGRRIAKYFPVRIFGLEQGYKLAVQCKKERQIPLMADILLSEFERSRGQAARGGGKNIMAELDTQRSNNLEFPNLRGDITVNDENRLRKHNNTRKLPLNKVTPFFDPNNNISTHMPNLTNINLNAPEISTPKFYQYTNNDDNNNARNTKLVYDEQNQNQESWNNKNRNTNNRRPDPNADQIKLLLDLVDKKNQSDNLQSLANLFQNLQHKTHSKL